MSLMKGLWEFLNYFWNFYVDLQLFQNKKTVFIASLFMPPELLLLI
jgi:hypothetical protein